MRRGVEIRTLAGSLLRIFLAVSGKKPNSLARNAVFFYSAVLSEDQTSDEISTSIRSVSASLPIPDAPLRLSQHLTPPPSSVPLPLPSSIQEAMQSASRVTRERTDSERAVLNKLYSIFPPHLTYDELESILSCPWARNEEDLQDFARWANFQQYF